MSRFCALPSYEDVSRALESPVLFIKPCSYGSSVGISKVRNAEEYHKAAQEAFLYDTKILIEKVIEGAEIECSVTGHGM